MSESKITWKMARSEQDPLKKDLKDVISLLEKAIEVEKTKVSKMRAQNGLG